MEKYEEYFLASLSRENTTTDNAVAERFIGTFKKHKINNTIIEEELFNNLAVSSKFNAYRAGLNKYVQSLSIKAEL